MYEQRSMPLTTFRDHGTDREHPFFIYDNGGRPRQDVRERYRTGMLGIVVVGDQCVQGQTLCYQLVEQGVTEGVVQFTDDLSELEKWDDA